MIKRINFFIVFIILFFVFATTKVSAANFALTSIGNSTITSQTIKSWSYAGLRPTFRGTTNPSGAVTVTIDSSSLQVYADSSGNWVFTPTSDLTASNHNVSITNGTNTLSFTLSLTVSGSLPRTGGTLPTMVFAIFGVAMILTGRRLFIRK